MKASVEVYLTGGGLGLYLVGLPDNAVKESEQRIRAAFENTGRKMSGRKVVVNLAPADLRKEGAGFDLPIAVGILAAMCEVSGDSMRRCRWMPRQLWRRRVPMPRISPT